MPRKRNQSAITHIEVTFQEIDRIYDLLPGTLLTDTDQGRGLVYQAKAHLELAGMLSDYVDEDGHDLYGSKKIMDGVYRGVRVAGYLPFVQAFVRQRSTNIDQKYVYVWSGDGAGKALQLEYELYFHSGSFQKVAFDSPDNKGKDTRQPAGESSQRLQLDLLSFWGAQQVKEGYFFLLAPYQLPWAAVQDLNSTVHIRGAKLWDWFYTDIYTASDPKTARPVTLDVLQGKMPDTLMFRVHLVDPFKESLNRSVRFSDMLRQWEPVQKDLGKNREYLLALRIDDFAHQSTDMLENVKWWDLTQTEKKYASDANKLFALSNFRCAELLRWVGIAHQPDWAEAPHQVDTSSLGALPIQQPRANTWLIEHGNANGSNLALPNDWHSPYSNAVDDYMDKASAEIAKEVSKIANRIHEDLLLCPPGAAWLDENFKKMQSATGMGKVRPELGTAHGGASILFPAKRKAFEGGEEFNAGLLRFYAKSWVKQYREEAPLAVKKFLKEFHDLDIELVEESGVRRIRQRAGRQLRKYRKKPDRFSPTVPRKMYVLDGTRTGFHLVALAVEYVNLNSAYEEFKENRHDLENQLELSGSVLDAYLALTDITEKLPNPAIKIYQVNTYPIKFCPIAAASAAIDIATAGMDAAKARTTDEGIAHGIRVVGASLTLAGTFTEECPVGWILTVAGLVLQAGGQYAAANLGAAPRFLRYCEWGSGGSIISADVFDYQNEDWYRGNLSDLARNVERQHEALDNIIFDYEPKIWAEGQDGIVKVYVRMRDPEKAEKSTNLISPDAQWNVHAEIYRSDDSVIPNKILGLGSGFVPGSGEPAVVVSADEFDDLDLTEGKGYALHTFQWPAPPTPQPPNTIGPAIDPSPTPWDTPEGSVKVKLKAKLDVLGDGTVIIERQREASIWLYLHT